MAALDGVDGEVVVRGWTEATGASVLDRIAELRDLVGGFLVTFVEREGRLGGVDLDAARRVVEAAGDTPVTIAGGVTTPEEVAALDRMGAEAQVGMALYTGRMSLADGFAAPLVSDRPDGLWPTVVCDEHGVALGLAYSNAESLRAAVDEIVRAMEAEQIPFELIIMDDGSTDRSFDLARQLAREDDRLRALQLSRNYSSPYSQFAGLSVARGACVTSVPDDHQCPVSVVVEMYRSWERGNKVVVANRRSRDDGRLNDFFSNLYWGVMNQFSDVAFPPGGSDRFLADREVVDILNTKIHPINTTPVLEVLRLGYSPVFLEYDRPARSGRSRWTLRKKVRMAAATFFGSSSYPLRLITVLGLGIFVSCLFLVVLIAWARIFADSSLFGFQTHGWATTMVVMMMFNGLILLSMGIVAEYIWRIHEEVRGGPVFVIREAGGEGTPVDGEEPDGS